ncbi:MAG: acyl-CoA dehydrogenase family protein [Rhodospirillaceae bacterium]|jgi:acyl-CoA dehydrogenase|nr:acyl-CoA dehydrogenase family protein [Rhodospirillaceae bacterium]MBT5667175.1 acyl-CoA dehydrogenase family protein [Rhodospirillaceae bacterium]MBT5810445.1 acyl-CoA dehydrogenase family protein [Rhodospirillaceae bacterium]
MAAIAEKIPEELEQIGDAVEAFCRAEVIARHQTNHALLNDPRNTYREDGRFVDDVIAQIKAVRMASAKAGFYNVSVPEDLGGAGFGMLAYYTLLERIYRVCGAHNWLCDFVVSHWAFGPSPVLSQVTERAKSEILNGMIAGETIMCFGMSEPGAGSDAAMLKTRAVKSGEGWKISGRKIWTTHIPIADYCIVFAITDPDRAAKKAGGISTFLVPTSAAGVTVESIIRMHGHIGGNEGITVLEDVDVEPWQLVGELHEGFRIGLFGVSMGRIYNSARAVGLARWALEMAIDYASQREAFGNPIAAYQGVSFPLADSATEIHAAHLMGLNVAQLLDNGERAIKELSMTKSYSVQAAVRAVDRAIQTHGAMGFTNELGLHDAYARVRQANVADGTNEILSRTIAQRLFKGDTEL